MLNGLPPVPSVFGPVYYFLKEGTKPGPTDFFLDAPGPLLPNCTSSLFEGDAGHALATSRMLYWCSWYFFVAIVTVVVCYIAHAQQYFLKAKPKDGSGLPTVKYTQLQDVSEMEHVTIQSKELPYMSSKSFFELHLMYHAACIALCFVSWLSGTLCPTSGIDWEFWAIWQLGMSLSFVVQALFRNARNKPEASLTIFDFVKPVFMSIIPGMSETVDTMKDWVVTGMCVAISNPDYMPKAVAFALFVIIVDLCSPKVQLAASSIVVQTCIPLAYVVVVVVAWIAVGLVALVKHDLSVTAVAAVAFDGACLGILSAYSIVRSHMVVYSSESFLLDLGRSFLPVLCLPDKRKQPSLSFALKIQGLAVSIFTQMTSDVRQVIAWNEDWPQGFLGLIFAWRRGGQTGFAFFSAVLSVSKGLLIPLLRAILVTWKMYLLDKQCDELSTTLVEAADLMETSEWQEDDFRCACDICRLLPDALCEIQLQIPKPVEKIGRAKVFDSLGDFLDTTYEVFKPVVKAARKQIKTGIAEATSVKFFQKARSIGALDNVRAQVEKKLAKETEAMKRNDVNVQSAKAAAKAKARTGAKAASRAT
eukprot:TRINITY_DN11581_c0_g1_i4.p1 TRINITY_DN11581_c0_g1~~TRINITY_DN11581_c0_g1_i4.p1  ORF type:complete len:589 (+),score=56.83 TRINITY_DN11581_c0_g1_i4:173-1939(+)